MKKLLQTFKNMKYRHKLTILLVVASLVPMTVLALYSHDRMSTFIRQNEIEDMQSILEQARENIDSQIEVYASLINYLTYSPDIEEIIREKNLDNYTAYEQYTQVADPLLSVPKSYHDAILKIQLFADSIQVEHEYTLVPLDNLNREWWSARISDDVRIQWAVDEDQGEVAAVRKIYDGKTLEAVLCVTLDYDKIFQPLSNIIEDDNGGMISDRDANIMYVNHALDGLEIKGGPVKKALEEMDPAQFRKYPDPSSGVLVQALSEAYGMDPERFFVGVGSDDVLGMAFLTFFNSDRPVLFPSITYSFYPVWADLFRIPWKAVPVAEDMSIRAKDYEKENGGIIFPNPNAPTGLFMPLDQVEEIVRANEDVIVIVDEAYIDFGAWSAMELTKKYDNLLVVQTFSKSRAMAGMRIGFAAGNPELIRALNNVKYSYNSYTMSLAAQELGAAALRDRDYFEETRKKIISTRERAKKRLRELGFSFPDSMTNFIFAEHCRAEARPMFQAMKEAGIYVRYFDKPGLDNRLRITIGTEEEMEQLYRFLERYLADR